MLRRFLVTFLRRSLICLALICLGCSAQSLPPDTAQAIERQVRSTYSLPPEVNITVGPRRPSEFPNYDMVTVTLDGSQKKQDFDFLLSKDGKSLLRLSKFDLTKDPYAETMKKIDVKGRPTRGNKDAKVVIVNYDDFECGFCSRMHQNLFPQLFQEYGDRVLFIYKDFPLAEIHPWATHAAVDANCLAAQNTDAYWGFADYIHSHQREVPEGNREIQLAAVDRLALLEGQRYRLDAGRLQGCVKTQNEDAVKASMREADSLGVSATPTMYVNGEKIDGAVPVQELRAVFDRALKEAGVPPPNHSTSASAPTPANVATPAK
jgi:protein-disulfide isomerase